MILACNNLIAMEDALSIIRVKQRWNEVLDFLERSNRTAWLVYFDARLVSLSDGALHLSFADAAKLGGAHDFSAARKPHLQSELEAACREVLGVELKIVCD